MPAISLYRRMGMRRRTMLALLLTSLLAVTDEATSGDPRHMMVREVL